VFDERIRRACGPRLDAVGRRLAQAGFAPSAVTASGWIVGVGACVAAATKLWSLALLLWLANRALDGLDGPVARAVGATDRGGFFDIVADFSIYGGFVVGLAIALPQARLACLVLLLAYYVSGTAFLALSSLLERRGRQGHEVRSLRFVGGLAEGAETVIVYVLFCLLPGDAAKIAWTFSAIVAITAVQRITLGARMLASKRRPPAAGGSVAAPDVP